MALRDPGAPRRNPLFAVDDAAESPTDDPAREAPDARTDERARPTAGWEALGASLLDGSLLDASLLDGALRGAPGAAVGPWMHALQEAGPEAAEHLVNAAHELTLAVKVVIDAVEHALADQRRTFAEERIADAGDPFADDLFAGDPFAGEDPPPERGVRRIDVE